jgi:hypothetical protein
MGLLSSKTSNQCEIKMKILTSQNVRDLVLFALLAAIGIVGRWAAPTWNFTPLAAVTVIGGFYFRNALAALLLPVTVLVISDLALPSHDSLPVMLSVHVMMLVPLLLGRMVRRKQGLVRSKRGWRQIAMWGLCGVVPATTFYLVTNFAVWAFKSSYEPTLAGLSACYVAGLPFYRAMLAGDLFFLGMLLACFAAARVAAPTKSLSIGAS